MNKTNTKTLIDNFPHLYRKYHLKKSRMAYGFQCGDGWFNLILRLSEEIERLLKNETNRFIKGFAFEGIKEEFGVLRISARNCSWKIRDAIRDAELDSGSICEMCGEEGKFRYGCYIATLCDKCNMEFGGDLKDAIYEGSSTIPGMKTDYAFKINDFSKIIGEDMSKTLGFYGKMLYNSKSHGRELAKKKKEIFVPNANIFILDGYKAWYGDFQTDKKSLSILRDMSQKYKTTLYLLYEVAGRFQRSIPTTEYLMKTCLFLVRNGEIEWNERRYQ